MSTFKEIMEVQEDDGVVMEPESTVIYPVCECDDVVCDLNFEDGEVVY
ncbi:MAG: hypothetical protein KAS32_28985 [Candidatus Peribacteraceae bacterium]|nr:hypothetical protein [Candidatus Peribacteraceae bacterium]